MTGFSQYAQLAVLLDNYTPPGGICHGLKWQNPLERKMKLLKIGTKKGTGLFRRGSFFYLIIIVM
jgi:hypothetical protein